jgi:hydroxysqualene synthase
MDIYSESGYANALELAKTHYENFPVVSFLVPKKLKKDIAIIYWFARTADDIADEGDLPESERYEKLEEFKTRLTNTLNNDYKTSLDAALSNTIKLRKLEPGLLYDLISAFQQDVVKKRYNNREEVMDYCRRSANPVGRLILQLYGIRDERANELSDKICTALQITNFIQDLGEDFERGRIYIPEDELKKYGITEEHFINKNFDRNFSELIEKEVDFVMKLYKEGEQLLNFLRGRLYYEIRWTLLGGKNIMEKIKENKIDLFVWKPKISRLDYVRLLVKSLLRQ